MLLVTLRRCAAVGAAALAAWTCTEYTAPAYSTLAVVTSTSGVSPDPDGYNLVLSREGSGSAHALQPNGVADIPRSAGVDSLNFGGASPNCALTSHPPAAITIPGDQEIDTVRYTLVCAHANGAIAVTTDVPDSLAVGPFPVTLDGSVRRTLSGHDSTLFSDLADGSHLVTLAPGGLRNVPAGCTLAEGSANVVVANEGVATATLSVQVDCGCTDPLGCD